MEPTSSEVEIGDAAPRGTEVKRDVIRPTAVRLTTEGAHIFIDRLCIPDIQLITSDDLYTIFESTATMYPELFKMKVSSTQGWRQAARMCCCIPGINGERDMYIHNEANLTKDTCLQLMKWLMGDIYCVNDNRLKKKAHYNGHWVVAVTLTKMLRKVVVPYEVTSIFQRIGNQGIKMTNKGKLMMRDANLKWPPLLNDPGADLSELQVDVRYR